MSTSINWKIEVDNDRYWIYEDHKFRIWGTVEEIDKFLTENFKPVDTILLRKPKVLDVKIKGKQFLEEHHGSIKTLA